MVKPVTEYTKEELEEKIVKIKAERERTAEALKKYEAELERRKQEVPLGVPWDGEFYVSWDGVAIEDREEKASKVNYNSFNSRESAEKHSEMLLAWRKDGLLANAKGEPIDIKVLLPLLPKGWVAMNKYKNEWVYHKKKPTRYSGAGLEYWESDGWKVGFLPFNLKPAEDWRNSLMECGL